MSVSFQGVGQVCATFLGGGLSEGAVVKMSGRGTVGACGDGDGFCGMAVCCKDDACTVQVGGFVTVSYSGAAPAVGWRALAADGNGGVKAVGDEETGSGRVLPVVNVDAAGKTVTVLL